jgi:hypothetical protein
MKRTEHNKVAKVKIMLKASKQALANKEINLSRNLRKV